MAGTEYKVVLLGDAGVGKSTFFRRLKGTQEKNSAGSMCTKVYTFGKDRVSVSRSRASVRVVTWQWLKRHLCEWSPLPVPLYSPTFPSQMKPSV